MAAEGSATEAISTSPAAAASPASQGVAEEAPLAFEPLHAAEGFCEIVNISADGSSMLCAGWDGKLAAIKTTAGQPPSRAWMARIACKGGMDAAAVSTDAAWLAFSQEYANGFGVWVCPLDGKTGPCMDRTKLVARFTLPVKHLSWHSSLPILGIASNDGKFLTWDRSSAKKRDFPTGSAGGSVHCVAFDPQGELVATALASGALVVFSMEDGKEKYRGNAWKKNIMAGGDRFLMAWRPDGSVLALPGATAVRLVKRGSYATSDMHLELGGHRYPTSMAAWSPDGSLLATASIEAVALWGPPQLLKVCRVTAAPHSLLWGGSSTLAVGTVSGSWAHVAAPPLADAAAAPAEGATQENPETAATNATPNQEGVVSEQTSTQDLPTEPAPAAAVPLQQAAFQPGATRDNELRRRYLAFNGHGTLKLFLVEKGGRVEVEYNQLKFRSAVREIKAPDGLVMGALGAGACALATAPKKGQPAKVVRHLAISGNQFGRKANSSHIEHVLPEDEEVQALAVDKLFVASLSSKGNLRVQTASGEDVHEVPLSGTPVCLVACADMLLCILKRSGSDLFAPDDSAPKDSPAEDGAPAGSLPDQELCLDYVLYSVTGKQQLATGLLPLSPGASLRWCGFSAESLPLALDSAGVLWALSLDRSKDAQRQVLVAEWQPAAELEDGGRRLWPVHAEGHSLHCLELAKGAAEPRLGGGQKLRATRFQRPDPARAAANQKGEAECKQALQDFEAQAKMGNVEEALDVILDYFDSHSTHRSRLLKAAHSLAVGLGNEELVERLSAILGVMSGASSAPEKQESQQQAAEDVIMASQATPQQQQQREEEVKLPKLEPDTVAQVAPVSSTSLPPTATQSAGGLDPEVARRIAEKRAQALERKAAIAAAAAASSAAEKRPRSPSRDLLEAPSAVRLRAC